MTNYSTYSLNNIPEGTTHVWLDALDNKPSSTERLAFYKRSFVPGEWLVYSRHTGWRKSQNVPEWFENEIRENLFKSIDEVLNVSHSST